MLNKNCRKGRYYFSKERKNIVHPVQNLFQCNIFATK